jgi:uncharacterized zinc-type alcohol dehydrogenase-like protein
MTIKCQAAMAARQPLEPFQYQPSELGPWYMEVAIRTCGIGHSDIHLIDNDWGITTYPLVPGHEIVGTVTAAGDQVSEFEPGQRIGIGWQRSSCLACEYCRRGEEQLCIANQGTCVGHYGGFAEAIRVDSRFAFPVPEALTSEQAAPLLCGGITVYSPLRFYGVQPYMRVGVIGVGGLGHLAIQFARAFGCEVTAFSSTPGTEEEARNLGAHHFVWTGDNTALKNTAGSLDFILSPVSADIDWAGYVNLLKANGKLCIVGVPPGPVTFPATPLLLGRKTVCGSVIGGRATMREMLDFATRHGIGAGVGVVPMGEVNRAIQRLRENRARYRMVLEN